jgi:hypothetical protein
MTKLEEFVNNEKVLLFVLIGLVISSIFMIMIGEFKGVGRR